METEIENYLRSMLNPLIAYPEKLEVFVHTSGESYIFLEFSVGKEDIGKIIGKEGLTIKAIRKLIDCFSASKKIKIVSIFKTS